MFEWFCPFGGFRTYQCFSVLNRVKQFVSKYVSKMLANGEGNECRPYRSRTCDTLIKSKRHVSRINNFRERQLSHKCLHCVASCTVNSTMFGAKSEFRQLPAHSR